MFRCFVSILLAALCTFFNPTLSRAQNPIEQDEYAAVIFAYGRIGDDFNPGASLDRDLFEGHIKELTDGDYNVLALPDLVKALKNKEKIPANSVAITFDSINKKTLDYAAGILDRAKLPYTVFLATDAVDEKSGAPDWNALRRLSRNPLVSFGIHPASYTSLPRLKEEDIARMLNKARSRFREEMRFEAMLFAYPYGIHDETARTVVQRQNFDAAFGQQSGVAYGGSDVFNLPRFMMTNAYGDIERFRMTARALPLPVSDAVPVTSEVASVRPKIGFTIDPALKNDVRKLSCFASNAEKADIQFLGGTRVEIRLSKDFEDDRGRINCTMPGPFPQAGEQPRWRWFGMLLSIPLAYPEWGPSANSDNDNYGQERTE